MSLVLVWRSLWCTESEAKYAIKYSLQLSPDLKEIKLFNSMKPCPTEDKQYVLVFGSHI